MNTVPRKVPLLEAMLRFVDRQIDRHKTVYSRDHFTDLVIQQEGVRFEIGKSLWVRSPVPSVPKTYKTVSLNLDGHLVLSSYHSGHGCQQKRRSKAVH